MTINSLMAMGTLILILNTLQHKKTGMEEATALWSIFPQEWHWYYSSVTDIITIIIIIIVIIIIIIIIFEFSNHHDYYSEQSSQLNLW